MKVALITEGTYPLHPGGVSAWCDQLVRGLPEVRFEVVALSGSGREPVAFTPPGNVAAVRRVGLWARVPRGKPFTGRTTERFVGAYAQMFESVLRGGPRAAEWFETSLRTLRELSRRGSLTGALRSQLAVDVLLDVWSRTPVPGAPADVAMTLADALVVTDLVEHFLRPLQLPPPQGAAGARDGERPVDARRADGQVGGRDAGAALRARRLPAGTTARGTPRRLPAHGADRAGPVLPPAVRAGLPRRGRRAAGQRLQRAVGLRGGAAARPGPHAAQRRRPARAAPAGGRAGRADARVRGPDRPPQGPRHPGPGVRAGPRAGPGRPAAALRRRAGGQRGLRGRRSGGSSRTWAWRAAPRSRGRCRRCRRRSRPGTSSCSPACRRGCR